MSNYRDDTQETAIASDFTWAGMGSITEEVARIAGTLAFGLVVMHSATAVAADEVIDSARSIITEQAVASDTVLGGKRAVSLTVERATPAGRWAGVLRVLHQDSAAASDSVSESVRAATVERAQISDEVIGSRSVATLVSETARASASTSQVVTEVVSESVAAADLFTGKLRAKVLALDAALLADEVFGGQQITGPALASARIEASVFDHLTARDVVDDGAVVEEGTWSNLPEAGQAWTANADTWAMSRYAPYSFTGLAVIDGVAYGMAADGVYALNDDAELIAGSLQTGRLDIGKGALVHPLAAYLEYELDGTAEMDVTTTQSGQAETYTYTLPQEVAGELTNGRFVFGRGLRGRHFSFALRLTGTHGYINDLSVNTAPTKRRV
ncbi:hypothetical protein vBPaeMUSP18_28 [Pseudomonas phage vB_PaeM_USP_18]|nr:hypothetical protein vBPaeMUSP18_28 [Pseudomonas phage vB_PaeM_USP_18]